jgi:inorganic phosphate transporter, PiT family
MDELLVGLAAVLAFVFGWNNSSFLIGNLRGSGTLSYRTTAMISAAGLLVGALFEGPKMAGSLVGALSPSTNVTVLLSTIIVTILLTLAFTLVGLPVSFSVVMVGGFLGGTVASGLQVDAVRSESVILFWFVAPFIVAVFTFVIYSSIRRFVSRLGILAVDSLNRAGAAFSALAVSYALGANNIGLILGGTGGTSEQGVQEVLLTTLLIVSAAAGMLTLGRGSVSGTVGDRMLSLSPQGVFSAFVASSLVVWIGTQLAIPVSISQCLLGGMLGAAYTRSITVLNTRLTLQTVSIWVIAPLLSFVLSYAIILGF